MVVAACCDGCGEKDATSVECLEDAFDVASSRDLFDQDGCLDINQYLSCM